MVAHGSRFLECEHHHLYVPLSARYLMLEMVVAQITMVRFRATS